MEPKPFASLTASLLARKGTARPAMRRAYTPGMASPNLPASVQDDLGWNDMGETHAPQTPPPSPPPLTVIKSDGAVVQDQARPMPEIAPAPATPAKANALRPAPQAARAAKAAFTLRLDQERHLRLRLACAMNHRSAQQIVTEALDVFLRARPEIESLALQVPVSGGDRARTDSPTDSE